MVIYSSAPRASIDGAWESRFDTVRSYSLSESGVRDPSGIFTCRPFRSSNGQAYRWSIIPFSISPTGRHQVFGCRMSTFMVSLKLTSFIFQDRKNVSLRVGTKFENNLSKERKRANPTVNIILEEKFRISLFIIGRWLDRDREIFRLSMYVRGDWNSRGKVQRHDTLEAIGFSPGRIAGGCDLLHFLESTAGQHIAWHARPPLHLDVLIFALI